MTKRERRLAEEAKARRVGEVLLILMCGVAGIVLSYGFHIASL